MIRPIETRDVPQLAAIHSAALPGSFVEAFGPAFLHLYYQSLLADPRFFADGFFWEGKLGGFLTYTTDSGKVFVAALRRRLFSFAAAIASGLLADPRRLLTVARALPLALGGETGAESGVRAEMLSFGVLPEFRRSSEFGRRTGRHVARELLHRAFSTLAHNGASRVKIYVQPEEVNPFIHRFYRREGFVLKESTRRLGTRCIVGIRELTPGEGTNTVDKV